MSSALFSTLYALLKPEFSPFLEEFSSNQDQIKPDSGLRHDFSRLKQQLEQEASNLDWQAIKPEIQQQLQQLLDIRLFEVLLSAWSKHASVEKVIKRQQDQEQDEVAVVPLPPHKIRSDHKPTLRVLINQQQAIEVALDIRLLFKLRGVVLKINQGRICSIMTGDAIGVGRISHRNVPLTEARIDPFKLLALNFDVAEPELETLQPSAVVEDQKPLASNEEQLVSSAHKKLLYLLAGIFMSLSVLMLFARFVWNR